MITFFLCEVSSMIVCQHLMLAEVATTSVTGPCRVWVISLFCESIATCMKVTWTYFITSPTVFRQADLLLQMTISFWMPAWRWTNSERRMELRLLYIELVQTLLILRVYIGALDLSASC